MSAACCPGPGDAATWPKQSTCGIDPRVDVDDETDYELIGMELLDIGRALGNEVEKMRTEPDFTFDRINKLLERGRELLGEAL